MVREKKDTNPVLFKFGVAVAISLGGIFYSFFRLKKMNPSLSPSPPGLGNQVDQDGIKVLVKDETFDKSENQEGLSQISNSCTENGNDETLLPEFEEIVNDFSMPNQSAYVETLYTYESESERIEKEEYEEEIHHLNNRVEFLQKRISTLENELLKYYGLKDQESTIKELQNRVKIHNTEAKLFNLKIEALQADNKKLKAQVVDYSKTVSELEAAKETINVLKNKLKAETEHNKKQLLRLQLRVKKMQHQELEAVLGDSSNELKVKRIKELEEEAEELRSCNNDLRVENLELAEKLKQSQMLSTSLQDDHKVEALKEETHNLRQQNEELSKQVEQLQSSWCSDIEELVYLRWINACLRYEARNYQPEPGKTSSRDLSKTLSPKSEEKAKQLIMEYANKQGLEDKGRHITDSDFDQWSFSQFSHSNHSDNGEFEDDLSVDHSSSSKTESSSKRRIFSKLRRLLRGEDENIQSNHQTNFSDSPLFVPESNGDGNRVRRLSLGSGRFLKGLKQEELKELERGRRNSDIGFPRVSKSLVSETEDVGNMTENQLHGSSGLADEKSKLVKYAEVFKGSSRENSKFHRRAMSHC